MLALEVGSKRTQEVGRNLFGGPEIDRFTRCGAIAGQLGHGGQGSRACICVMLAHWAQMLSDTRSARLTP